MKRSPFLIIFPMSGPVVSFINILQPTVKSHPITASATDSVLIHNSSTTDKLLTHKLSKQLRTVIELITASVTDKFVIVAFCIMASLADKVPLIDSSTVDIV